MYPRRPVAIRRFNQLPVPPPVYTRQPQVRMPRLNGPVSGFAYRPPEAENEWKPKRAYSDSSTFTFGIILICIIILGFIFRRR